MQHDLMEILACPVCKGPLTLTVEQTETLDDGREEILAGTLDCADCGHSYRIDDGLPDLMPPALGETPATPDPASAERNAPLTAERNAPPTAERNS